jgi:hypothetical protein
MMLPPGLAEFTERVAYAYERQRVEVSYESMRASQMTL